MHPVGWECLRGGTHRALFVMLISWPNLNDPDICWPACVKPHIQFVPQIQKVDKTLEAGKNVCVCVCSCCWCRMGEREKSFYSNACTTAIITRKEESQSVFLCVLYHTSSVSLCVCALMSSTPHQQTHPARLVANTHTHKHVCVCSRAKEQWWGGSLFNGRDRGPWGLSSPQLEALEERLGAVLLIQVGLIMPVHPLPLTLPPLHQICEETHDKGRQAGGGGSVSVCVCTTCGHLYSRAWALGTREISPLHITALRLWHQAFLLLHFHARASFVEAALGLINTQTIWQMLSTGSGTVPLSNEAFSS